MSYDDYNDKHNFTFRFDSNDGERHLEMNVNELYLYDIFARFKEFLQGCGYEINGEIEVVEYNSERDYDSGYTLTEPPKHEPKFDFSNIPNNNWPFGELKTESIPALTTADLAQIQPVDLSSLTVTDLSTLTTKSWSEWSKPVNEYPTMAPLTSEQVYSWSTEMPGTLGGAKVNFRTG
jgi:hypothetical protein